MHDGLLILSVEENAMYRFLTLLSVLLLPVFVSANDVSLVGQWKFDKDFDGKFTQELPSDILPKELRELTFTAWVKPADLSGYREIIRKEDVGANSHAQGGENRLLFSFQDNGKFLTLGLNTGGNYAECDALIDPKEVMDGKEHFVAGTFDGKTMHVYLDGQEIGSYERQGNLQTIYDFAPVPSSRDVWAYNNTAAVKTIAEPFFIGSSNGKGEFFAGGLNDVRFYKRALDIGELQTLISQRGVVPVSAPQPADADKFYVKQDTFVNTLIATQKNTGKAGITDSSLVALHRLIRNDFPNEVNAYLVKFQRSPVEMMLWNVEQLQKRAGELKVAYAEYMPLTEEQWKYLNPGEQTKWERVKNNLTALNAAQVPPLTALYPIVLDMELTVEPRPRVTEAVAPYQTPETPETKDRTAEEVQKLIETEWLFQCGNKPTIQRSLDEINWARNSAARILKQYPNQPHLFDNELEILATLNERAVAEADAAPQKQDQDHKDLYFAVRTVKRNILFKNPVLDFDTLLLVDGPLPAGSESAHETRHQLGYMGVPGGRLLTVKMGDAGFAGGHQEKLLPHEPLHGSFWRPDVSYDGKKVLASFKPHNEKTFHLYEVEVDTKKSRQLTSGMFDDLDPVYLPDGKNIMFLTTRGHIYVRCMPPTNAMVMARMDISKPQPDTLYITSRNGEPEYTPSVMNDGRVIFTRWEYTDKPLWRAQSLWTMNADGTQVQTFWGNQSVFPDLLKDARSIPNSERVMFIAAGHHNWFGGVVAIIDPGKGFNYPDGLTKVTQELPWVEVGNGPDDGTETMKESKNYHPAGAYNAYYSPYPLSEKDFLVSARRSLEKGKPEKWVLLLMDCDGNRELVFEGEKHIFDAKPLRARPVPQVKPDQVEWTTFANRDNPPAGVIYSNNVYENAPPELKDKAKFLRIWSIEHKTYTYWSHRNYASSGPEISMNQSEGVKKIIGTVPIESDGSVSFNAPSGVALHFQLLDENHLALQTMKSFTGVLPGETRGCLGCHESMTRSPVTKMTGKALKRVPSNITPVPWEDITVGYERYVQSVLDKHCGECHENPEHKAYQRFNMTLRPGFIGFKEPYVTLMGRPTWGSPYKDPVSGKPVGAWATEDLRLKYKNDQLPGGYGWADTIMVEAYDQRDVHAYQTYPPMTKLSYKSRLVERMMSGKHNNVKVEGEDLLRVILWVDAMGPYYGAEEVRCMADPIFQGKDWISQPPRVMTAPVVPRPGPFDPYFYDSAYDAPPKEKINALPAGVKR
jgi:hypothetical protein